MESKKMFTSWCLAVICLIITCQGSNILLFPVDGGYNSRLRNMLKLGRMLVNASHQVTCVISDRMKDDSLFKLAERGTLDPKFKVITYKTPPLDPGEIEKNTENQNFLDLMIDMDAPTVVEFFAGVLFSEVLENILQDKAVIGQLTSLNFDVIIADEIVVFPRILAAKRKTPLILYSNFGPMSFDPDIIPRYSLAYVNGCFNRFSDVMPFRERLENVWEYIRMKWVFSNLYAMAEAVCYKHGYGKSCENIRNVHKTVNLVLMNRNDLVHYPAPYMPHIISSEGFFMEPPKPLDAFYDNAISQSGKHGVIVISFGSQFRRLGPGHRGIFAKAFSVMPQTVIWSYEGEKPQGLGENTIINKWIPQTDLLANPAVKLFVTQCGASALFEALKNGVPVLGVPFIGDQEYNCQKLVARVKSAIVLPLKGITSLKIQGAMEEIINNVTYAENAKKGAVVYHDQPMDPRNKTLYWIEYVIRHKGALHLRSAGEIQLNFFQYYLLDIAGFVVALLFAILFSFNLILNAILKGLPQISKTKVC